MKTYSDVIQSLIDTNDKLIKGEIKVDIARQVAINTQVFINASRLLFDVIRQSEKKDFAFFLLQESEQKNLPSIAPILDKENIEVKIEDKPKPTETKSLYIEANPEKIVKEKIEISDDMLDPMGLKNKKEKSNKFVRECANCGDENWCCNHDFKCAFADDDLKHWKPKK